MAGMGVIRSSDYESPESANGMERSATQRKAKKRIKTGQRRSGRNGTLKTFISPLVLSPSFLRFKLPLKLCCCG